MTKFISLIIKYTRRLNISTRLIGSFFLISILPLLIISLYFYSAYSDAVTDKLGQANLTALLQISKTIDATLEDYQYLGGKLSIDPTIQDFLSNDTVLSEKKQEIISRHMNSLISDTIVYPPFMKTIKILDNHNTFIYDMGYDDISFSAYQDIMDKTDQQKPDASWSYVNTFMGQKIIILGHRINSTQNMNTPLGYTLLFISEQIFTNDILSAADLGNDSTLVILNTDGTVLTSNHEAIKRNEPYYNNEILDEILTHNPSDIRDNFFTYQNKDAPYLVVYTKNKTLNSYIISSIPFSYIREEAYKIIPTVVLFILLILGICILLSTLLYHTIMRPIHNAVDVCKDIRTENFSSRIEIDADDELAFLSININQMLDKNQQLLSLIKKDEERKRVLEIQMLQYQINPHFLFNTLSTLKWIAELNQVPVLEEMITSLSEILKSSLINNEEFVCLSEEIRILNYYIQIQKVRYLNKFEVQYELPPELDDFRIPRFILQPLVENSIYHGTYNNGKMILITVSAFCSNGYMLITVSDNGKGFDSDRPREDKKGQRISIGIQNVQERISRIYKAQGNFQIKSKPGAGTCCTITLPATQPQTLKNIGGSYVSDTNS
ncbi:hypothetical protein GCM10008910_27680 [Faecalicatena orotica]|uniref:Two-component system sensor histidine kinase YesM n=1 Tax=Faecalicatena orotica TaxID=1544 RepID=A0A2Y9C5C3_9FIRM|nr:sensor histidine kinase [Faecalicatena orotica]PWJ28880.1 two-component system sensor histidine kinase YesM [Faecalicatena orotica]SSA56049.1 two-component system, sensor histidine kinase YesM [Faecalicatena orotica]